MKELEQKIYDFGMDHAAVLPVEQIRFEPSLISLCESNACGNYGKNWTCPPRVGNTKELIAKAKTFKNILVFQKIYQLEDSFDVEGMQESSRNFQKLIRDVHTRCKQADFQFLLLGAGGCRFCEECAAVSDEPCRFPEEKIASLESYSIQVSSLAEACGMKYINGANTVTYFGGILY